MTFPELTQYVCTAIGIGVACYMFLSAMSDKDDE